MKIITLKVEIEVSDDYVLNNGEWLLYDAADPYEEDVTIKSVSKIEIQ
jgi:hypothetical protein